MNRIVTVTTKVRPIKKLFIIEQHDFSRLIEIIKLVSDEIDGLSNLILLNDDKLFSKNTLNFVYSHDPDVVINYSKCSFETLRQQFRIDVFDGIIDEYAIKHFSTPLRIWDTIPPSMKSWVTDEECEVYSTFQCSDNPLDFFFTLHFGLAPEQPTERFETSIFKNTQLLPVDSLETFHEFIFPSHENNYLYISRLSSSMGNGGSIWEIDHNPDRYFDNKPTLIIGDLSSLESAIYFWNMRATYPRNETLWFPIELLVEADQIKSEEYLKRFDYCCVFGKGQEVYDKLTQLNTSLIQLPSNDYYFRGYSDGWLAFTHTQNVAVVDEKIRVLHPSDRLFSTSGWNLNFVLEVRGLNDTVLPKGLSKIKVCH